VTNHIKSIPSTSCSTFHNATLHSWKKRYFVLDSKGLSYFKDNKKNELLDTLPPPFEAVQPTQKKKFGFELFSLNRTLKLAANSEEERDKWMGELAIVVLETEKARRETVSSLEKELELFRNAEKEMKERMEEQYGKKLRNLEMLVEKQERELREKEQKILILEQRMQMKSEPQVKA